MMGGEMEHIRKTRRVPAKRGMRVRYGPDLRGKFRWGTIKSARGGYLMILLDGDKYTRSFHPTWHLEYGINHGSNR